MSETKANKQADPRALEKLTERVQNANDSYLYQAISRWHPKLMVGLLACLGLVTLFVMFNRTSTFSNHSSLDRYTRAYFNTLYGKESALATHVDTELKKQWSTFAFSHEGVERINLVTKVCEDESFFSTTSTCFFSYQTNFKDGSTSMTYGMKVKAESDIPVTIEPQNIRAGTMLLTVPTPFKK